MFIKLFGDKGNPTRNHINYKENKSKYDQAYLDMVNHGKRLDGTEMTTYELEQFLINTALAVIETGTFQQQKNEDFNLNVNDKGNPSNQNNNKNNNNSNFKRKTRVCANVMRYGFCTVKGCKYAGLSKEEMMKRKPCKEDSQGGKCKYGDKCIFKHKGDTYDESKKCVHRGEANKINNTNEGGAEDAGSQSDSDE